VAIELVAQHIQDIIWAKNGLNGGSSDVSLGGSSYSSSSGRGTRDDTPISGRSRSNSDSLLR